MGNQYLLERPLQDTWSEVLSALGLSEAKLIAVSSFDLYRRVYRKDRKIYKVVVANKETSSHLRSLDLAGEFKLLSAVSGVSGVPVVLEYNEVGDYKSLTLEYIEGTSLAFSKPKLFRFWVIIMQLSVILGRLSLCGVSHNDIRFDNVLCTGDGRVWLIDFDQATQGTVPGAFARNFIGLTLNKQIVHHSLITLVKNWLQLTLPRWAVEPTKRLIKFRTQYPRAQLAALPDGAGSQLRELHKAWLIAQRSNASAPGNSIAYYSLNLANFQFPGERPWLDRWAVLQQLTEYKEKRILELGCNMALLSCFLLKKKQAAAALAVDADADILEAARLVASAFEVTPQLAQKNFDEPGPWEEELADFEPDIVFALNIMNWVKDKTRLLTFLSRFERVIFEGHESIEVETKRFEDVGFRYVDVVGLSERNRPILHCLKHV